MTCQLLMLGNMNMNTSTPTNPSMTMYKNDIVVGCTDVPGVNMKPTALFFRCGISSNRDSITFFSCGLVSCLLSVDCDSVIVCNWFVTSFEKMQLWVQSLLTFVCTVIFYHTAEPLITYIWNRSDFSKECNHVIIFCSTLVKLSYLVHHTV
jgi:hypothetical protein